MPRGQDYQPRVHWAPAGIDWTLCSKRTDRVLMTEDPADVTCKECKGRLGPHLK